MEFRIHLVYHDPPAQLMYEERGAICQAHYLTDHEISPRTNKCTSRTIIRKNAKPNRTRSQMNTKKLLYYYKIAHGTTTTRNTKWCIVHKVFSSLFKRKNVLCTTQKTANFTIYPIVHGTLYIGFFLKVMHHHTL